LSGDDDVFFDSERKYPATFSVRRRDTEVVHPVYAAYAIRLGGYEWQKRNSMPLLRDVIQGFIKNGLARMVQKRKFQASPAQYTRAFQHSPKPSNGSSIIKKHIPKNQPHDLVKHLINQMNKRNEITVNYHK